MLHKESYSNQIYWRLTLIDYSIDALYRNISRKISNLTLIVEQSIFGSLGFTQFTNPMLTINVIFCRMVLRWTLIAKKKQVNMKEIWIYLKRYIWQCVRMIMKSWIHVCLWIWCVTVMSDDLIVVCLHFVISLESDSMLVGAHVYASHLTQLKLMHAAADMWQQWFDRWSFVVIGTHTDH